MRTLVILVLGLFVSGCGGSSDEESVGKEIADDLIDAMDQAREVGDKMLEHKEQIDKALQEVDKAKDEQGKQ